MKTSMKFGNQYGCGEQLNCRMFMTLFSYFNMAAIKNKLHHPENIKLTMCHMQIMPVCNALICNEQVCNALICNDLLMSRCVIST